MRLRPNTSAHTTRCTRSRSSRAAARWASPAFLPGEERFTQFKSALKDKLVYMLGGRAAEEIIFGDFTTGAGNDLQRATRWPSEWSASSA